MRLAVPTTMALDDLDDAVAKTFERALESLSRAGALIERIEVPEFNDVGMMNAKGGFAAAESYALASLPAGRAGRRLRSRRLAPHPARRGHQCGRDYIDILNAPTVVHCADGSAHRALRCAGVADHGEYASEKSRTSPMTRSSRSRNLRALRNCTLINVLDGCAISLPAHRDGEVPVGLMLAAAGGSDRPHSRTRRRNGEHHPCLI